MMFASRMNSVGYGAPSSVIVEDVPGDEFKVTPDSIVVVKTGYTVALNSETGRIMFANLADVKGNYDLMKEVVGSAYAATLLSRGITARVTQPEKAKLAPAKPDFSSGAITPAAATSLRVLLVPLFAIGALTVVGLFVLPGLFKKKGRKR